MRILVATLLALMLVGCGATPVPTIRQEAAPSQFTADEPPKSVLARMPLALEMLGGKAESADLTTGELVGRIEHPFIDDTLVTFVVDAQPDQAGSLVRIWAKPRGLLDPWPEQLWRKYSAIRGAARADVQNNPGEVDGKK